MLEAHGRSATPPEPRLEHHRDRPTRRRAEVIARPHKLTPLPEDGLRERWFGDLVGTPSHDHDWREDPPNGETLHAFVTRTQAGKTR